MRVCEKHFDESGIFHMNQWLIGGVVLKMPHNVPKLLPDAVPRIFPCPPTYLSSEKRSQARPPTKCRQELSAELETVKAASTLCMSPFDTAAVNNNTVNEHEHTGRIFLVASQ